MANKIDDGSQYEAAVPVQSQPVDDGSQYELAAPAPIEPPTTWDKVKDVAGNVAEFASIPTDLLTMSPNKFDPQFVKEAKEPFQDFKRGVTQGATLNFGDELSGLKEGAKAAFTGGGGEDYVNQIINAYRQGRDEERNLNKIADERSPWLYGGGQLAGGIALGAATGGTGAVAGGLGRQVAVNAARGLAEGAAAGLGNSEADLTKGELGQAAVDTAMGATLGAGAGAVGTLAGAGLAKLTEKTKDFFKDQAKKYALKATGFIQSARNKLRDGQEDYLAETLLSRFVPRGSLADFLSNSDGFTEQAAAKYGFKSLDEIKQIMDNPESYKDYFEKPIVTAFAGPAENLARVNAAKNYLGESLDRTISATDNIASSLGDDLPGGWFDSQGTLKRIENELIKGNPTEAEVADYVNKLMREGFSEDQALLAVQKKLPAHRISGRFNTENFPEMEKYGRRLNKILEDYDGKELSIAEANEVKKQLQAGANWNPTRTNDELKVSGANKDASRIFREEVERGVESAGKQFQDMLASDQISQIQKRVKDVKAFLESQGFDENQIREVLAKDLDEIEKSAIAQQFLEGMDFKNLKNYNRRYGALADIDPVLEKEINRRAGNASPGLIDVALGGGTGGTAGAIAGALSAGPLGAVVGAPVAGYVGAKATNIVRNRLPAMVAGGANRLATSDLVKKLVQLNPGTLGKWGGVLARAAARGEAALNAAHFTLSQTDPEYQQKLKELQTNGANQNQNDIEL